jgi:enamine deaminase RidA (YjgF/YER057c/UK114 family)
MHVFAVAGTRAKTICLNGQPAGRTFSNGSVKHCLLGDLRPSDKFAPKPAQCRQAFENLECALRQAGMSMANLLRTWFFLDDIHSWYREFNDRRNAFYRQREVFKRLIPASTGVGGRNPTGAAVVAGAWAVQAPVGSAAVREVPSPLQCPSLEYGSAFSRAVLVTEPGLHRLLVSGTASIEPSGRSAHVGNVRKQIGLAMEVVQAILASRGFDFCDVTRATAYFKNVQDMPAFDPWLADHDLDLLPLVVAQADLCREELLFEIELDAIMPTRA